MIIKFNTGQHCELQVQSVAERHVRMQECPQKLIKAIERAHGGLKDDTSIIVLDLLPLDKDFPAIAGRTKQHNSSRGCMCFAP